MTVQDLVNQYNGQSVNTDGADNGQCTAIPHAWEQAVGAPVVYGNAIDTYDGAPESDYDKELNTPDNFPKPGSIMVFEANNGAIGTGPYGHTGVVVAADVNGFDCFEQNDEPNPNAHVQHRDYTGVKGWFYPRLLDQQVTNQEVDVISADDVKNLYLVLLGRAASDDEANTWAGQSWHDAYYGIKDSPEGQAYGASRAQQLAQLQQAVADDESKLAADAQTVAQPAVPDPIPAPVITVTPVPPVEETLTNPTTKGVAVFKKLTIHDLILALSGLGTVIGALVGYLNSGETVTLGGLVTAAAALVAHSNNLAGK